MALTNPQQQALDRWLYDEADQQGIEEDLAGIGEEAFVQRLKELGQALGVEPGPIDEEVKAFVAKRAKFSAGSVVKTHNNDLRDFLERLDPSKDAAAAVHEWEAARSEWKGRQIAFNEAMTARNQADRRFRSENDVTVQARVVPLDAVCPICQDYVDMGYMDPEEADALDLPAHINCQHSLAYAKGLDEIFADRDTVWLGSDVSTRKDAA